MSKIMVPIDFSENSILALQTAIAVANKLKADLRMVYVAPNGGSYAQGFADHVEYDGQPQDKLEKLLLDYRQQYAVKGKFDYKILSGNVAEELINVAKYDQVSLIVTGSHGVSGISKSWIGGNAYKLICNATCPVLVIRQDIDAPNNKFQRMAIPINVSKSSRRKMPDAAAIAKLFGAKTIVIGMQSSSFLSIFSRIKAAVRQVVDFLQGQGVEVESTAMLKGDDCTGQLLETVKVQNADMIIVEAENTGAFFADRFRPELTGIINNAPCPVLVIPVVYK